MERALAAKFEVLITDALRQLTDVLPVRSSFQHTGSTKRSLDSALLAAAARKRGFRVLPLSEQTQVVYDKERMVGFHQNMPSTLSMLDRLITNDKELTKRVLHEAGLPVAQGRVVRSVDEAFRAFRVIGGPVVIKPIAGSNGNGITVGVQSEAGLKEALQEGFAVGSRLLIEECIPSIDLRIMVSAGHTAAAMMRVPANIVGDGHSAIRDLIEEKNRYRAANAYHRFVPIKTTKILEAHLREQELTLASVPGKNQRIFLHYKANLSSGGDSVNITDRIHPALLRLAEDAMASFRSANHGGVDILAERIDSPPDAQRHIICEVNCNNDLPIHVFPLFGASIDVARMEVDAYLGSRSQRRPVWRTKARGRSMLGAHLTPNSSVRGGGAVVADFTDLSAWAELPALLSQPTEVALSPARTPRKVDAQALGSQFGRLGWDEARVSSRLITLTNEKTDVVLERSGRSVFAGAIAARPEAVYRLLAEAGIPACRAMRYAPKDIATARDDFGSAPGPWDLQPAGSRRAAGKLSLRSQRSFEETWSKLAAKSMPMVLQQAADGLALKLLLLSGEVVSCLALLPAGVVGDGKSSVAELLETKVGLRARHPYLRHFPVRGTIFQERNLSRRGLTRDDTLQEARWVLLSGAIRPEAGGESVGFESCPVPGLADTARGVLHLVGSPRVGAVTFAARPKDNEFNSRHWAIQAIDPDPVLAQFAWPWAGYGQGHDLYARAAEVIAADAGYQLRRPWSP